MMKRVMLAVGMMAMGAPPALAANLSKTYSYFTVGGTTLEQLQEELAKRGPQVKSTGQRHPGATRMEFSTRIGYREADGYCRIEKAVVTVKAKVILPRWRQRARADRDVRLIWDTLSSDIKRHEESHVVIARTHARDLEQALHALPRQKTCSALAVKAKSTSATILARHDRKQEQFDRVEGINFERRMDRLLNYRMQRIESGKIPG